MSPPHYNGPASSKLNPQRSVRRVGCGLARALHPRARARARGHGHRLSRPRPEARPAGRAQGAARRTFDNDRGAWAIVRAQTYHLRGDHAKARVYADWAWLAFKEQLRAAPLDGQRHVFGGLALAYLGRRIEAIQEGERGVALLPTGRDAYVGAYLQHQLVRIYLLVGEPERALDQLEPLLRMPYYLSPGWLRIDPTFAPLRGNPRFDSLGRVPPLTFLPRPSSTPESSYPLSA